MADGHRRVRRIFTAAVERPRAERATYLAEACSGPDVRRRVESLLAHHDADPWFLEGSGNPRRRRAPGIGDSLGDFRILRKIGEGGTGIVYEASDGHRHVAIKVLHERLAVAPGADELFRREAALARRLSHPNILPVHDLVEDDGQLCIVSELSSGRSLARVLRDRGGPLPEAEAIAIAAAVARALDHAHRHGILHRDVKPANILMESDGTPRLTDFGHAKDVDAQSLSASGELTGTLFYMSPEQSKGLKPLDGRTDVFSLGVVLYEMLTGRRPFQGTTPEEILTAVQRETPPGVRELVPGLSRDLAVVCGKALEKERRYRYRSAGDLARELDAVLAGRPIEARPPGIVRRVRGAVRRHARAAAAALALAVGVPVAVLTYRELTDPSPRVAVTSLPGGAVVEAIRIDPAAGSPGPARRIGRATGNDVRIREGAGYYRIVARVEGLGTGEATRYLPERSTTGISLRVLPTDEVTASMVRIDLDDPAVRERARLAYALAEPPASYWIDRCEVSNAEFRRYLEESGAAFRPALWDSTGACDPAWDDLPAAGIPYEQAQAYAEWNGKRLPTRIEWEIAARGPDAALYPWGGTERLASEELRTMANVFGNRHDVIWSGQDRFPQLAPLYAGSVLPVAFLPPGFRDLSPAGLYHTLGNVAEWTESVPVHGTPAYQLRVIKGDHWGRDLRERWSLSSHMTGGAEGAAQLGCGFRCAKSDL